MLDKYVIGVHERNSPEANVPVILKTDVDYRLGGAANVAMNLIGLEIKTTLFSVIGKDFAGEELKNLCQENSINHQFIELDNRLTTVKARVVDEYYKQFLRIDTEVTTEIDLVTETQLKHLIAHLITNEKIDGLIIQDYNKGILTPFLIKSIQALCIQSLIPIFVDPKHQNFKLLADGAAVFKPNLKEVEVALQRDIMPTEQDLAAAIIEMGLDKTNIVFITLADKGIYYQDFRSESLGVISGQKIDNPDVSGAGDTVIAVLAWAYLNNHNPKEMAFYANKAGAKVCMRLGVSFISQNDVLADI